MDLESGKGQGTMARMRQGSNYPAHGYFPSRLTKDKLLRFCRLLEMPRMTSAYSSLVLIARVSMDDLIVSATKHTVLRTSQGKGAGDRFVNLGR